jgi:S-DNA-T family DNA segregation ATPase FtsK/SpoIIIE
MSNHFGYTGRGQEPIEVTASFMQATLNARAINAIVAPLWDGPQVRTFRISLAVGVKPEDVERLGGALSMAAGVSDCRICRSDGHLVLEVAKPAEERQVLMPQHLLRYKPNTPWKIPIGVNTSGRIVWFDLLDDRTCHAVLGGTTGSGKSNLLHWILFRVLAQNPQHRLQLLLMDPKGYELSPFKRVRHLIHPPEHRPGEIVKMLLWLEDLMAQRGRSGERKPRILVVIDEVRELAQREERVRKILGSIAQIGRGLGVHLLVTTQQPGAKALGEALPNFPARLLGRVASKTLTYGAAGRAKSQAHTLLGRGDFLLITQDALTRFQAPLMKRDLVGRLPATEHVPRLDLGESLDLSELMTPDRRGGHNRKPLDLQQVQQMVLEEKLTASQLGSELNIYYGRAQRLVAVVKAVAKGTDARSISLSFDIPYERARRVVDALRGE